MEARYFLRLLKKWYWLLILTAILGAAIGLGVGLVQPKTYEASSILLISTPNRTDWNATTGDQAIAKTFPLIPQSTPVLDATIKAVNAPGLTASQLASKITIDYTRDTQYLTVRVRDSNPAQAAKLATEVVKQSVLRYQQLMTDNVDTNQFVPAEADQIKVQIQTAEKELAAILSQPNGATTQAARVKELNDNLTALRQSYNQIINTYYLLNSTQPKILQEAQIPTKPLGQGPLLGALIGLIAGLIVIVGVIIFVEINDDTVRTPARVTQASSLPTLISVQSFPTKHLSLPLLAAPKVQDKAKHKRLPLPDAFLALNAYLYDDPSQTINAVGKSRTLLVTSPEEGDGKTMTAAQVAVSLAKTGTQVILVDANLRSPKIHDLFALPNQAGLSSLLKEDSTVKVADVLQKTPQPHLSVLTGGPSVETPAELLSSAAMSTLLTELTKQAFVVIDSPSVLTSSDSIILASKSDMVIMVVNARRTTTTKLKQSLDIMPRAAANVLGVVLNRTARQI